VRWTCRSASWSEESNSLNCLDSYCTLEQRERLKESIGSVRLTSGRLPSVKELEAMVNGFNCRKLTYPEDALYAFAGVASELQWRAHLGLSGLLF
jgi:hypothetical protein